VTRRGERRSGAAAAAAAARERTAGGQPSCCCCGARACCVGLVCGAVRTVVFYAFATQALAAAPVRWTRMCASSARAIMGVTGCVPLSLERFAHRHMQSAAAVCGGCADTAAVIAASHSRRLSTLSLHLHTPTAIHTPTAVHSNTHSPAGERHGGWQAITCARSDGLSGSQQAGWPLERTHTHDLQHPSQHDGRRLGGAGAAVAAVAPAVRCRSSWRHRRSRRGRRHGAAQHARAGPGQGHHTAQAGSAVGQRSRAAGVFCVVVPRVQVRVCCVPRWVGLAACLLEAGGGGQAATAASQGALQSAALASQAGQHSPRISCSKRAVGRAWAVGFVSACAPAAADPVYILLCCVLALHSPTLAGPSGQSLRRPPPSSWLPARSMCFGWTARRT
jgi:hypothetical protein